MNRETQKEQSDFRYFNFPIQLLKGFMTDHKRVLENISNYALYKMALTFNIGNNAFKIQSAKKYFDFNTSLDNDSVHQMGEILNNSLPERSPMTGIKISILLDFYKNEKTDFQKVCLLGFLAIKSILQRKAYCKIDNKFWLSRMDGNSKSEDICYLSPELAKFSSHYQTRKIKDELIFAWNLITYSHHTRGFYVSFSLQLETLIFEEEKRRKSSLKKQLKIREKNARLQALKILNESDV